ncbi:MAG: phosphoribosylformylglycinamidine synthase subunit PurS [bacterium]|jgi:phosphoribosylformylglycinamidine synthase PurS subunit|nr:phosphoribosylformylglycinamidine synthase subunit PurS [bacterium]MDD3805705.1 phosphoribosylformylglycinamidine synthase subunit PurS [bacterium]MDD4152732.1 phosphoribosylformylglycinamidine synthase subunit PurS [bacterium]MDD4557650.1 phosphoribosylformylglycinamidine synthase subunit PurS [bacterium]
MYRARIFITLKKSVFDTQGQVVRKSLQALNFDDVEDVRMGKYIELQLEAADKAAAEAAVRDMCERLLVNTVIEQYGYEVSEA